jgi:tripartite-type tricarboxylate transporter receptor subunit TctC
MIWRLAERGRSATRTPSRNGRGLLLALLFLLFALPALAQSYPTKPVRIIVPFPAGQGTDIVARVMAEQLSRSLRQQFVVDNRGGAGGIIGTEAAAKAPPDGYTLVMATSGPIGINPGLYPKLPYDAVSDFAPISNIALVAQTLVTPADGPITSLQDLLALMKAKPGEVTFASSGNGTTSHLTLEMLRSRLGLDVQHVPYRGSPAAMVDVIAGTVTAMFDAMPGVLGNIKGGKLRPLAVSTPQRSPFLPDVPTIAETVSPGFDATGWIGIAAPAGTPPAIVRLLHGEIVKALGLPEVKDKMRDLAFTPVGDTPEAFAAFIKAEIAKWTKVVRDSGAKVE